MRRPHEMTSENFEMSPTIRRHHENDVQKRQNDEIRKSFNRCFRCHLWNLRGRFSPVGFAKAELTSNSWKNEDF